MGERNFHDEMFPQELAIFRAPMFQRVTAVVVKRIIERASLSSNTRVLSIGCGVGTVERQLAPAVGEIIGVDISPVAVDLAKQLASEQRVSNVEFRVADVCVPEQLAPLGAFDAIIIVAVLHHISDEAIPVVLRMSMSHLKPGGRLYSSDPSRRRLIARLKPLVARQYAKFHSQDERELDAEAMAESYVRCGFCDVSIGEVDLFAGPTAWLAPWMPDSIASCLIWLDQRLVKQAWLKSGASTFDVCARRPAAPSAVR